MFRSVTLALITSLAAPLGAQTTDHFPDDSGSDRLGTAVDGGADIDGDGIPDFVVGGSDDDDFTIDGGTVRAISGADFSVIFDIDGSFVSPLVNRGLGRTVACVGDTNGDGHAEFLASGNLYAALYSGRDGGVLRVYETPATSGFGPRWIAALGDVNADGHADYSVSSANVDALVTTVQVFSGRDGSVITTLTGFISSSRGDVNGDGFDDFVVTTRSTNPFGGGSISIVIRSGRDSSVISTPSITGGSSSQIIGDLNQDGRSEYAVSAATRIVVYSGITHTVMLDLPTVGFASVGGIGDWNGDGIGDIAIGEPTFSSAGVTTGRVQVLSGVDGTVLDTTTGIADLQRLGSTVAGIGDRNGDGAPDYICGSGGGTFGYAVRTSNLAPGAGGATTRGVGCSGSDNRQPRIQGGLRAKIGQSYPIRLRGGPLGASTMGSLIYGAPQSLSLASIGLPECTLLVDPFGPPLMIQTNALGMFSVALPFPNDMAMLGLALDLQCALSDATAPHALGLSFSDALGLVIGQ